MGRNCVGRTRANPVPELPSGADKRYAQFATGVQVDDGVVPTSGNLVISNTMPPPSLASDGAGRLYAACCPGGCASRCGLQERS